jgi:hypothetical protein
VDGVERQEKSEHDPELRGHLGLELADRLAVRPGDPTATITRWTATATRLQATTTTSASTAGEEPSTHSMNFGGSIIVLPCGEETGCERRVTIQPSARSTGGVEERPRPDRAPPVPRPAAASRSGEHSWRAEARAK